MKTKVKLSIVILNYNTKNLLLECLNSIQRHKPRFKLQVIVVDNGSTDSSCKKIKKDYKWVELIENKANLGFAAGNNKARERAKGEFVLFLNSDTLVKKNTLSKSVYYLQKHKKLGALTCKIVLPDGSLDKDTRRSFITPWIGFTHLFLKLDRLFPRSRLFGKYWYGFISENKIHKVDAIQGAFFLTRKKILDKVGWFDEDYFLDGEDIDLCWKIKDKGWNIVYYPKVSIIHVKGATKGKNKKTKRKVSFQQKRKFRMSGVDSMETFYKKRLWDKNPLIINLMVVLGIKLVKIVRFINLVMFG